MAYDPPEGAIFRLAGTDMLFRRTGTDPQARKYKIRGVGIDLQNRDERCTFAPIQCEPADGPLPFDTLAFLGRLPSASQVEQGREWAEKMALSAEDDGKPNLAEVWRRVAKWDAGKEVRLCLGAFGMADDVTRKWGVFWGLTPTGAKHFVAKMGDGRNRNLVIQSAIFEDLYEPGAQALGWESAYDC